MEFTIKTLLSAMISNPSSQYLLDGFPRTVEQAQYFGEKVFKPSLVLYYEVSQDLMIQRGLKRAETSGRSDDNLETIKKRVQSYFSSTLPVIEYYNSNEKDVLQKIDATGTIEHVYE